MDTKGSTRLRQEIPLRVILTENQNSASYANQSNYCSAARLPERNQVMSWFSRLFGGEERSKTVAKRTPSKPPPTTAPPSAAAAATPAKTVKCPNCGHVQREGQWEREMDRRAKAQGMKGFVNLSAPPRCLKCEAALDGSGQKTEAPEKEVTGVCDICNQPTSTGRGGKVFKNRDMKQATERGFNGLAIGTNAAMLAGVGTNKKESYGLWKQRVMRDTTDWLLCPQCQKKIGRYT